MKIGFDYDGTLTQPKFTKLAKAFIENSDEVWLITSRLLKSKYYDNQEVLDKANEIGIPEDKIIFTQGTLKYHELTDFNLFFDDNVVEIEFIETQTDCVAVKV